MIPIISPSAYGRRQARPCWVCQYWGGWVAEIHSRCSMPGGVPVMASPADGCAFWTREPGSDDEPIVPPVPLPGQRRHTPALSDQHKK